MAYLHLVLECTLEQEGKSDTRADTLEQEGKSDTRAVSVAISQPLLLLSPMLWLISGSQFYFSNIHHQSSKFV